MPRTAKPRGPYAKSADQRRRILEVAVDVFGRLGNRGSSLREIADKVGMSQAGVLHHFGSKNALLMAVLEQRDHSAAAVPVDAGLEEQAKLVRSLLSDAQANPGLTQLFVTLSAEATNPEHPARAFFEDRYREVVASFAEPIRQAQASGAADESVDPVAMARLVTAAMDGLQLQQLLDPEADPLPALDMLIEALLKTYGR